MKTSIDAIKKQLNEILSSRAYEHKVNVWQPVGFEVLSKRNKVSLFYVSDKSEKYKVSKRFSGRRLANVYGKRNYRDNLISDINFTPVTPVEYITLNITVNND